MPFREQDLAGQTAVVTGASRGIGRAIATNLAMRGCNILGTCTGERSLPLIDELREEVHTAYDDNLLTKPTVEAVAVTLTDKNAHETIGDAIARLFNSRVNIFINNAATVERTPVGALEEDAVATMCLGNIQTPAMIIDELVKRRYFRPDSRIIFISSTESSRCAPEA